MFRILLPFFLVLQCASGSRTLREVPESAKVNVLVEYFSNNSVDGEKWKPWEIGFPSMIQDDLLSTGFFRVVSSESRKSAIEEYVFEQSGLTDGGSEIGSMLTVAWIVKGNYIVSGNFVIISANVVEAKTARVLSSRTGKASVDDFFTALKDVSTGLLRGLHYDLSENEILFLAGRVETESYSASLKNYRGEMYLKEAEDLKRVGKGSDSKKIENLTVLAIKEFKSAISEDPNYEKAKKNLAKLSLLLPSSI